jgi:hypothetical protein
MQTEGICISLLSARSTVYQALIPDPFDGRKRVMVPVYMQDNGGADASDPESCSTVPATPH